MPTKKRLDLKEYFENGDKPNEDQFGEFIDSVINIESDEVYVDNITKNIGLGINTPSQKLDVDGAIRLDNVNAALPLLAGTIRWTGDDFEGYTGTEWKSLTKGEDGAMMYIPVPRLSIRGKSTLYAYWEDNADLRFKDFNPKWYLYRYKGTIKQKYNNGAQETRLRHKKWVHPDHLKNNPQHGNTTRKSEFTLPSGSGSKKLISFSAGSYFKDINGIKRPRGQGRFSYGINKGHYNRRFEYFKLRTVIEVEGKKYFGPFSESFAVGQPLGQTGLIYYLVEPSFHSMKLPVFDQKDRPGAGTLTIGRIK